MWPEIFITLGCLFLIFAALGAGWYCGQASMLMPHLNQKLAESNRRVDEMIWAQDYESFVEDVLSGKRP